MRSIKIFSLILFALGMFCQGVATANDTQQLQQTLANMSSFKANFNQVVRHKTKIIQRSQGSLALWRPGRFRWDSTKPIQQLIIADGKKLWVYDKELKQVSVKPVSKGAGTPAFFLSGADQSISRYYHVKAQRDNKTGEVIYNLSPKGKSDEIFRHVLVVFSADKKLKHMQLHDHLGQVTEVDFTQAQLNPKLKPSLFHFTVPQGVDVVSDHHTHKRHK